MTAENPNKILFKNNELNPSLGWEQAHREFKGHQYNTCQRNQYHIIPPDHTAYANTHKKTQHEKTTEEMPPHWACVVFNPQKGKLEEYQDLTKGENVNIWKMAMANELSRLAQGTQDILITNTIKFIHHNDVPIHKKVTYA